MSTTISYTQSQSSVSDVIINDEFQEDEILEEPTRRKVRIVPIYVVHDVCIDEASALNTLKEEKTWQSWGRQNKTKDGLKIYHDCIERGCPKKIGLWYDLCDATVRIAKSAYVEHDHTEITYFDIN